MKKIVSLKLIVFSFLLVTAGISYSAPAINPGTGTNSIIAGEDNKATKDKSSAFGHGNLTNGFASSAFGYGNSTSEEGSSAFGYNNTASGKGSSAFGNTNTASGKGSSAFGNTNSVSGEGSSAFGSKYKVTGEASGAFGVGEYDNVTNTYKFINEGNNSYMIGNKNKIASGSNNNFILGNNVSIGSGIQNSVALGNGSTVSSSNEVSVGSATQKRKITNVADGEVSATSTDAVTGKQLYSGEGIDVNAWQNKLDVTKKDASNLTASDISAWKSKLGVGNSISNSATSIGSTGLGADNNVTIGSGIQNSVALGNNSTVSSSNEVSVGSATQKRKITNVADGDVSATSTDAVNGRQLYKAMQNSNENLRNEVNEKIDDVKDEVNHVGSLSAALAGLHPMQYDPKAPTQVMAALGNYKNKQSVAVGLSYYFNDRFMMSAGVAIGSEKRVKSMANVGFTVKLGKGSGVTYEEAPQYTILDEVKRLTVENNRQAKENQELKERVKNLEEKLEMLLKNK